MYTTRSHEHNHNDINNNSIYTNANTGKYKTQVTPLFRYEPFINFWLRFFDTRRETQFLKVFRSHTMLTTPRHISWSNLNFWLRFFDTRRETQFLKVFRNHTMLKTSQRSAHLVVQSQFFNIIVGPQLLNTMDRPSFSTPWSELH